MLKLVDQKVISLLDAISRVTIQPARILGIDVGQLTPDAPADICIFDPSATWQVDSTDLQSRGNNTPFDGQSLSGVVKTTFVAGRIKF